MTNIHEVLDSNGNKIYIETHEKAVKCSDGKTLDEKLNNNFRLIADITTTEDVNVITITKDIENNEFKLKKIIVIGQIRGNSSALTGWIAIRVNNVVSSQINWSAGFGKVENKDNYYTNRTVAEIFGNQYIVTQNITSQNNDTIKDKLSKYLGLGNCVETIEAIERIDILANGVAIGAGSTIKVYGL